MQVPLEQQSVLVMLLDDRVWIDSNTLISYLRIVEDQASRHIEEAIEASDKGKEFAAFGGREVVRQIADGIVLTTMTANEEIRAKRGSTRRS